MRRKKKRSTKAPAAINGRVVRRVFASYAANRHLRAYMVDQDHRHIANAWLAYRKSGLRPDEGMLKAIDVLCGEVLKDKNAKARLRNSLRNAELHRIVTAFRVERPRIRDELRKELGRARENVDLKEQKKLKEILANWSRLYPSVARDHGISVTNLKQIMRNMRTMK